MKKLGIVLVVILFVTGTTFAQERGGGARPSKTEQGRQGNRGDRPQMTPEQRAERMNKQLVDDLKLNKDQADKVAAINKKYMSKQTGDWSKMRDASEAERKTMRDAMMKVNDDREKEIKALLTADQMKLYTEMQKKREESRRNGQGRMGGPGGQGQ